MLNRKLSQYIYYGALAGIVVMILIIRSLTLGTLNTSIDEIKIDNIAFQKRIDNLEAIVQENKEVQTSHLYELYDIIPNVYSGTELTYKTVAILESLGVDESADMQRVVYVNQEVDLAVNPDFMEITRDYYVVEVQVVFTTTDADVVNDFIDALFNSDQLFVIEELNYIIPTDENFVEVQVYFYAIYNVDMEEES